jgi:casein kinase 1
MTTPHVIASSSTHSSQPATTTGIVGNHFRVGKKIGEGSFGVVFEGIFLPFLLVLCLPYFSHTLGANLITNQPVAIKFVRDFCSDWTS